MKRALRETLGQLTENTGLVATIFVGGPEPRQAGEILTMQ
jgi:hypothetical protein